jgi:hypothetical protein
MTLQTIALPMILLPVVMQQQTGTAILSPPVIMQQQAAEPVLFRPLVWQQQQAAKFPQSSPLQDSPAVREEWRRAYKDFKPTAAVAARIEEL